MVMQARYENSPTKRKGRAIIQGVYDHLLKHGPTAARDLCGLIGCAPITVGTSRVAHFNEYSLSKKLPHRFAASGGGAGRPVMWSLVER